MGFQLGLAFAPEVGANDQSRQGWFEDGWERELHVEIIDGYVRSETRNPWGPMISGEVSE